MISKPNGDTYTAIDAINLFCFLLLILLRFYSSFMLDCIAIFASDLLCRYLSA